MTLLPTDIATPEQRVAASKQLIRIKATELRNDELDLAVALLLEKTIRPATSDQPMLILTGDDWKPFSVTSDWNAYGELVSSAGLVTGSHARYDDEADLEKVTGYWYSCHAFFGATRAEGFDLRQVVARSAALLLEHNVLYPPS